MSQTPVQIQEQLVARWRQMDAQVRYTKRKRRRDEEDNQTRTTTLQRTPNAAAANTDYADAHAGQSTRGPPENA